MPSPKNGSGTGIESIRTLSLVAALVAPLAAGKTCLGA
jgi:hypothetical protein